MTNFISDIGLNSFSHHKWVALPTERDSNVKLCSFTSGGLENGLCCMYGRIDDAQT